MRMVLVCPTAPPDRPGAHLATAPRGRRALLHHSGARTDQWLDVSNGAARLPVTPEEGPHSLDHHLCQELD